MASLTIETGIDLLRDTLRAELLNANPKSRPTHQQEIEALGSDVLDLIEDLESYVARYGALAERILARATVTDLTRVLQMLIRDARCYRLRYGTGKGKQ